MLWQWGTLETMCFSVLETSAWKNSGELRGSLEHGSRLSGDAAWMSLRTTKPSLGERKTSFWEMEDRCRGVYVTGPLPPWCGCRDTMWQWITSPPDKVSQHECIRQTKQNKPIIRIQKVCFSFLSLQTINSTDNRMSCSQEKVSEWLTSHTLSSWRGCKNGANKTPLTTSTSSSSLRSGVSAEPVSHRSTPGG